MLIFKSNNFHVYNLRSWININAFRPDFNQRKLAHFKRSDTNNNVSLISSNFKILSNRYNEQMLIKSILFVMDKQNLNVMDIEIIKLEAPHEIHTYKNIAGIMTFSRENIKGGWFNTYNFERELTPAELIITPVVMDIDVTPLEIIEKNNSSYIDVILYKK